MRYDYFTLLLYDSHLPTHFFKGVLKETLFRYNFGRMVSYNQMVYYGF